MRKILTALLGWAVLVSGSAGAGAETLEVFSERIKQAFASPDRNQEIMHLFNRDGMDDEVLALYEASIIPMLTRHELQTVAFEALPADFSMGYVLEGYEYSPNLEPLGLIVFNDKTRVPYGKIGERHFITGMNRVLVVTDPAAEITLQVNVFGFSTPPVRYAGTCDILQSNGKTVTMQIEDTGVGNNTMMLTAVRFESCSVTKIAGDGPVTLRVVEADLVVFEEEVSIDGDTVTYQRQ